MSAPLRISDRDIARVRELNPIAHVAEELGYELEVGSGEELVTPCMDSVNPENGVAFSMSLVPACGMFYCAHCGAGGDVIALVEKDKKLSFAAAVEYLAERAGVELELYPDPSAVRAARALRDGIPRSLEQRDVNALVANLAGWLSTDFEVRGAARDSAPPDSPRPEEDPVPAPVLSDTTEEETPDHG